MKRTHGAESLLSISIAPASLVNQRPYYDLPGAIDLMERLLRAEAVDGFEFQNLAEWDAREPPRAEREKRSDAWNSSPKYTVQEVADWLRRANLPILSVHANRDVGICLCSDRATDIDRGRVLIHESLYLAEQVGASVCVFHLWDTWREAFDLAVLQSVLNEAAPQYPRVRASVENVPTRLMGSTPFEMVSQFEWVTLDLRWAALYNELDRFKSIKERIINVHLRGRLDGTRWVLDDGPFGFYQALDTMRSQWKYSGLLTMEPDGLRHGDWGGLVSALSTLKV